MLPLHGTSPSHRFCRLGTSPSGGTLPIRPLTTKSGNIPLAKTNYSFEKRQREIAKKKKQDDKQAKKTASRDGAKVEPNAKASPTTDE